MPTNPTQPNNNAAIDRLALGVDSPRGTQPSAATGAPPCNAYVCFDANEVAPSFVYGACVCFEAEASRVGFPCACGCMCTEVE